jgi:hypothetical protein
MPFLRSVSSTRTLILVAELLYPCMTMYQTVWGESLRMLSRAEDTGMEPEACASLIEHVTVNPDDAGS